MRPYIRKILICVIPVLLALWAIWYAYEHDRFKLGVDLSGGTILVYEIDLRKQEAMQAGAQGQGGAGVSGKDQANLLAEKLKHRIDPNDLYNIVIRPAGEGRVEIILPTGGPERAERADQQWRALLDQMERKYKIARLDVNRGRVQELAEQIKRIVGERTWAEKLYNTPAELKALAARAEDTAAKSRLYPLTRERARQEELYNSALPRGVAAAVAAAPMGPGPGLAALLPALHKPAILQPIEVKRLRDLRDKDGNLVEPGLIDEIKRRVNDFGKEREIEAWFKEQAWAKVVGQLWDEKIKPAILKEVEQDVTDSLRKEKLDEAQRKARLAELVKARSEPVLKDRKAQLDNILPDSYDELIGRAVAKGDSMAQAFANTLGPVTEGELLVGKGFLDRKAVAAFLVSHYGPSLQSIEKEIEAVRSEARDRGRDMTVEEVQRVKELVSKVGSLEFRILANSTDDVEAIREAKALISKQENRDKLIERQVKGLPPPGPVTDPTNLFSKPKRFKIRLARGAESTVTYSWVELGKQERQQLGLNNNAENEPGRGRAWNEMQRARSEGKATELSWTGAAGDKKLLEGALFYSRVCEDRNLPEEERRKKKYEYFVLCRNPEIDPATGEETPKVDGRYLTRAYRQDSEGRPAVSFEFNAAGGALFRDLTRKNVPSGGGGGGDGGQLKRHLAIVLDGLIQSAPTINSEIGQHGQISGSFTAREVDVLVNTLRSGALPATLKTQPVSEQTLGATLGGDTIRKGTLAVGIAFLAVVLFMIVYYRFAGLVASVALLANLILTVGFMAAAQATFTLPGLAGLVLMLGMAVDANVLIYERLREERERGASLTLALRNGYDRALPIIIDMHIAGIFTAVVLYAVGNDQLKGFGISLTVGLIISLFTSLYMTRVIFDIWNHMGWLKKLSMFKLFSRPDIDFMAIRYYWFTATIILTLGGLALFIGRLPNDLNIDFVGGTAYAGQLSRPKDIDELRALVDEKAQKKMLHPQVKELDPNTNSYLIAYEGFKDDKGQPVTRTVNLANRPAGDTVSEREKNLAERASAIPDVSVEQIYAGGEDERQGKSRYFNVRTSEKEPELVQATLDQLLQEKDKAGRWESLLRKVTMKQTDDRLAEGGRSIKLEFFAPEVEGRDRGKEKPYWASPSFVRTLFNRELLAQFKVKEARDLPFQYDLTGEGQAKEGRFLVMKLIFSPVSGNLTSEQIGKIRTALDKTETEFRNRPQPERLETFDSQLAAQTRLQAMYAVVLSWGGILIYLWFRFGNWTFGLATVLCLIHDLFFTLGIIAACHYIHGTWLGDLLLIEDFKIDLAAVAALLTLVGYSVNDTIVVFDRIREVRGKNPELTPQMINDSVNQTLSRTLLTALTVWLVVFVLYVWGGPGLHLFAFVMLVGVIVGTYSSIYIASPLLLMFGEGSRATAKPGAREPVGVGAPDTRIQPAT